MQFNVLLPRSLPALAAAQAALVVAPLGVVVVVVAHGNCAWRVCRVRVHLICPKTLVATKVCNAASIRPAFNAFDFVHARQSFSFKKCALNVFLLRVFLCVWVWQAVCV